MGTLTATRKTASSTTNVTNGEFNILTYGASASASASANTQAFNQAIIDATPTNGTVIIPAGTYMVNTINYTPKVSIRGVGRNTTILKSAVAAPMFVYDGFEMIYNPGAGDLSHFTLDGNSIGTIGLKIQNFAYYRYHDLIIHGFTEYCADTLGMILGEWSNVHFLGNTPGANGVRGGFNPSTSIGVMQSNLNIFSHCQFQNLKGKAVVFDKASSLQFRSCDFENLGIPNDFNTGGIFMTNTSPNSEGVGLVLDACWFEVNQGVCVDLKPSQGSTRHIITNSMIHQYSGASPCGIRMESTGAAQTLFLNGSTIVGYPVSVQTIGGNSLTELMSSTVDSHTEISGGRYGVYQSTLGGGATPVPSSDTDYVAAVLNSNPIYFNYLSDNTTLASPVVGSEAVILGDGAISNQDGGKFANRRTTLFQPTATSTLNLDLSVYTDIAFEFFIKSEDLSDNYNAALSMGDMVGTNTPWVSTNGAFVLVLHPPNTDDSYFGYKGSNGFCEARFPQLNANWNHFFIRINNNGLQSVLINGVEQSIMFDTATAAGSTNTFVNAPCVIMKDNGKMSYFTVYAGSNIPSSAQVQAHYSTTL
jgi:Pectate lyase superfamily protein